MLMNTIKTILIIIMIKQLFLVAWFCKRKKRFVGYIVLNFQYIMFFVGKHLLRIVNFKNDVFFFPVVVEKLLF